MINYEERLSKDSIAIFLFHGVHKDGAEWKVRNYNRKHVPVTDFRRVIAKLRSHGTPISMDDIVAIHKGEIPLPENAFAVTFDDGFENTYWLAAPILDLIECPATWYITTGFVHGDPAGSWIDMVEASAEESSKMSIAQLDALRAFGKDISFCNPYTIGEFITAQMGMYPLDDPQLDAKLTWPQIQELSSNPLFTIGGHTVSHARLEFLQSEDLVREVGACINDLANHGITTKHFSYPEGLPGCERTASSLKWYGITCCPTAQDGVNKPEDDLFSLKRIMVV